MLTQNSNQDGKDNFTIKDSGARAELGGGVRDTEQNKIDYTLVRDGVMYQRYAEHLTKGARKYAARNWLKFFATRESALAAYQRAGRSLLRHVEDYIKGIRDEDHAAAVIFNLDVREKGLSIYPDLNDWEEIPKECCVKSNPPTLDGVYFNSPKRYSFEGCRYEATGEFRAPKRGEMILVRHSEDSDWVPWRARANYVDDDDTMKRVILRKVE
jgi:hypothetical protein